MPEYQPSANVQYRYETQSALYGILEMEFGFRKSFSAAIAEFCHKLTDSHDIHPESALWIGAGTGCGPFVLSNKYEQVFDVFNNRSELHMFWRHLCFTKTSC